MSIWERKELLHEYIFPEPDWKTKKELRIEPGFYYTHPCIPDTHLIVFVGWGVRVPKELFRGETI